MKKKKYISPRLRVVMLRAGQQLLAGSNTYNATGARQFYRDGGDKNWY